uniref:Uncharacterized protein n=1 Tax=Chrysolophus pictus TaxID=9089 RepID=A0A8C3LBC8_CHRPC
IFFLFVPGVSASSAIRQPATLAFFALSLVLLTGLVVLLSLFFQIYQDPEEGKKLQAMREALCFERRARNGKCSYCVHKPESSTFKAHWLRAVKPWEK